MKEESGEYTVGGLRAVMEQAKDETPILVEKYGQRFLITRAALYGKNTDDPVLVLKVETVEEK